MVSKNSQKMSDNIDQKKKNLYCINLLYISHKTQRLSEMISILSKNIGTL